jgi:DNA recombination protein RmuC
MGTVVTALAAAVVCSGVVWLVFRTRSAALEERALRLEQELNIARGELKAERDANVELRASVARLEATLQHERKASEEKLALVTEARNDLERAFKALSADALKTNNESFLTLASETLKNYHTQAKGELEKREQAVAGLVTPIRQSLDKVEAHINAMEQARQNAYGAVTEQVRQLIDTQDKLRTETGNLVKALRAPQVRGRWGEVQLRRVVEYAGMLPYCDFVEQASVTTSDGRLRPDLVVRLPGGKNVVVDAKAPLEAYLDALETADEDVRRARLADHAAQVREHMNKLASKSYWEQFQPTPEFVVMFLPGETFFSAALEQDASLIEAGVNQGVIVASPTTLISLLRAIFYGWRQETVAESAQKVSELGKELYDRLCTMAGHFEEVGKGLGRAVDSYNKTVASLETRVLSSARKFPELGAAVKAPLPDLEPVDKAPRALQAGDWVKEEKPQAIGKGAGEGD